MNTRRTSAIILRRINYGEADRILTFLTRDFGKIAVIAKGVRKEKSKLAGGIELMSESDISYIVGKNSIGTLISTQLIRHFGNIHTNLDRMRFGGEFLKRIDKCTEDDTSPEYYDLTVNVLLALNTSGIPLDLVDAWATMRLLFILGEIINIENDSLDKPFDESAMYRFSYEDNRFIRDPKGDIEPSVIKFIRLLGREDPAKIVAVKGILAYASQASQLLNLAYQYSRPTVAKFN